MNGVVPVAKCLSLLQRPVFVTVWGGRHAYHANYGRVGARLHDHTSQMVSPDLQDLPEGSDVSDESLLAPVHALALQMRTIRRHAQTSTRARARNRTHAAACARMMKREAEFDINSRDVVVGEKPRSQ